MRFTLTIAILLAGLATVGQSVTQTIRGKVVEADSKAPLPGATVAVYDDSVMIKGMTTNNNGEYRIEKVPVGRYTLVTSYVGYNSNTINDVIVNSAKQTVINIPLKESIKQMDEVVVTAGQRKGEALNEMATVSARGFSVDEANRYAGSRGDPARMAANFAGVVGNNDNSNDITVRGNSPIGLLWRMEGANIPNPNHFAVAGNTGGPVSILNRKVLANSDFYSGAFPAQYGNAVAGVFDLNLRNGNNENHEFTGQAGFLGLEAQAEGPFGKNANSSYLASYRYSTLSIFSNFGVDIGTDAVPNYQDLSMKLNFPINSTTNLSVFGIGGISSIDIIKSNQTDPNASEVYGNEDSDEHFRSRMGIGGIKFTKTLNENTYLRATLYTAGEYSSNDIDNIHRHVENGEFVVDSLTQSQGYRFQTLKEGLSVVLNQKINVRHTLQYGVYADYYQYDFIDSIYDPQMDDFNTRLDFNGPALLLQPYVQWQYRITENFTLNTGVHGQWLDFNGSTSIEPRLGLDWQFAKNQSLSIGVGRHSQMLPSYVYFSGEETTDGDIQTFNRNLGFMKSDHAVLGYNTYLTRNLRMKVEGYYQRLFDIPVTQEPSSYSVLNEGSELNRFFPDSLENKGTGRNYGAELTLEKFFSNNYFFLFTASLFDSKYTASDGEQYNTAFNSNFILNLLGTKEFHWGDKYNSTLGIGGKVTWAGGKRYTPIDKEASQQAGEAVLVDSLRNTEITRDYFRFDIKMNYKLNANNVTHEIGLDLVNVLDIKNVFKLRYVTTDNSIREEYQLGFLPIFYYRIDF